MGAKVARVRGAAKSTSSVVLWHHRLRHPSYKFLSTLSVIDTLKIDFSESILVNVTFVF